MAQKITYWLLVALILSLGFGQLLRFDFYGLPIYLHDILVVLVLGAQRSLLYRRPEHTPSFLFLAGLALSWIYALTQYSYSDLLVPFLYTIRLLAYLSLYVVIKRSKLHLPSSIFLISGLTTVLIGLSQYLLMPDMRLFQYLGWDDHLHRLTLPHFDPTFTAVMLGLFVLSLLKSSATSQIPVLLISSLAMLLTYARSVWLSLALTGLLLIRNKLVLLLALGCMLVAILFLPQRFGEGTNLLRTYSIESRFSSDLSYLSKYNYSLIIGRGLNTLMLDTSISERPNHATGPNNSYLYTLATTGLLGLVGWILIWARIYKKSNYKPMLIFFFAASLFNNVMFYPFALLWVLIINANKSTV